MPRTEFHIELQAIRASLVQMTLTAAAAIRSATAALLGCDLDAARTTANLGADLEARRITIEHQTYRLLALQQPVASDLRELVSAIKISADAKRMGSLANHVAEVARWRHPASAVPLDLTDPFTKMGSVASRIAEGAAVTLDTRDAADAARLAIDDDAMDGLRRTLFRALLADWPHGVEAAVNVALLGRYYERFADHGVAIAQSVVYVVTGVLPDDPFQSLPSSTTLRSGD